MYQEVGKTIIEKILAKAAGKTEVSPGEYIKVGDAVKFVLMGTDSTPTIPPAFKRLGWNKLWDPSKVMIAPDHCGSYTRARDTISNRESHHVNSEWARQMGVPEENILELGRVGNCHHLAVENGWALPGSVYLSGPDGHTMTVGGVGCFGSCLSAWATFFLRFGWIWFRVPESIKFKITGKLQDGIMGRDVYEYILSRIGPDGALYQVMEYTGPVMDEMSIDGRLSMCCLSLSAGAKLGIVNPDQKVTEWFKARTKEPFEPQMSDPDADYAKTFEFDISKIEPQVAIPPNRHDVKPVSLVEGTKITTAFIGSCASGRDEDLKVAAKILKGRKVHPRVMFNITPGSSATMARVDREGVIQTLLDAGCLICAPGCGMCMGFYTPLAKNEVCIASSTTNVPGRMGDESAQVYLGSAATVAASAIEGKITDPRKYL
jgi:3-isopropylmalate/(R)-2-methylmalate dehydratase large subunit